jgi:hypothetical protein
LRTSEENRSQSTRKLLARPNNIRPITTTIIPSHSASAPACSVRRSRSSCYGHNRKAGRALLYFRLGCVLRNPLFNLKSAVSSLTTYSHVTRSSSYKHSADDDEYTDPQALSLQAEGDVLSYILPPSSIIPFAPRGLNQCVWPKFKE